MSSFRTAAELENVFAEKLSARHGLSQRHLKKALLSFDTDSNGLLSLSELSAAVRHYVHGVPDDKVRELMEAYDSHGDGCISYEQLEENLMTRAAGKMHRESMGSNPKKLENVDLSSAGYSKVIEKPSAVQTLLAKSRQHRSELENEVDNFDEDFESEPCDECLSDQQSEGGRPWSSSQASSIASVVDPSDTREIEARAKVFFQSLQRDLMKHASAISSSVKAKDHLLTTHHGFLEKEGRNLLMKSFLPYSGSASRSSRLSIEFNDFCKVLRNFKLAGSNGLRQEVLEYIFSLCSEDSQDYRETAPTSSSRVIRVDRPITKVANPVTFIDLVFGAIEQPSYSDRLDAGRIPVGTGPFPKAIGTDPIARRTITKDISNESVEATLAAIPIRLVSHRTKTALKTPAAFSSDWLKRSAELPDADCIPYHVFGMSASLQSGPTFLPLTSSIPTSNALGSAASRTSNYLDSITIVYPTAALGIVHDLSSNTQRFFRGHSDDITCFCLSSDGKIAATGCVASTSSPPLVKVWSTEGLCPLIATIGLETAPVPGNITRDDGKHKKLSFFSRSVNALCFSADSKYLLAIGCDDHHLMGIFDVATGRRVIETPAQHGLPPQIKGVAWNNSKQYTDYVTRKHGGSCDLFATVGDHHLRLWSFNAQANSLDYKAPTLGKLTAPKVYTCCAFLEADLLAGGSNGYLYLYRKGECVGSVPAIKGGVLCLAVLGTTVYCAGNSSVVKVVDGRTMGVTQSVDLLTSLPSLSTQPTLSRRPSTSSTTRSESTRPRSASASKFQRKLSVSSNVSSRADDDSVSETVSQRSRNLGLKQQGKGTDSESSTKGLISVSGLAALPGVGRLAQQTAYLLVTTSTGLMVRVNISSASVSSKTVLHFHTAPVYGLCADSGRSSHSATQTINSSLSRVIATCGDDRRVCVWDVASRSLVAECTSLTTAAGRCCAFDKSNTFLAIGTSNGSIHVLSLQPADASSTELSLSLEPCAYRKDSSEAVGDVSFSPSDNKLAVGSHDNYIYIYATSFGKSPLLCSLSPVFKLSGHSSYLRRLDWSVDGLLLQSCCGANELLCWDMETGKLSKDSNPSDVRWRSQHCLFGFSLMGIWSSSRPGSAMSTTDINALDVSKERGLVLTADDSGCINMFNYPCIVKDAPKKVVSGHSSHVMSVCFLSGGSAAATVGGNDCSAILWKITDSALSRPGLKKSIRASDYDTSLF